MSDRVVGYLVLSVPRGSISDAQLIFGKKVLFPTWSDAVSHAIILAGCDSSPICLLREKSQEDCRRWQNVKIYELSDGMAIYVQAVFAPAI